MTKFLGERMMMGKDTARQVVKKMPVVAFQSE